jgi:surfactin synthase thioesterase subunit
VTPTGTTQSTGHGAGWVVGDRRPGATISMLCFPCAGSGASMFRDWSMRALPDVAVYSVQLPGREKRYGEPPFRRLGPLIDAAIADFERWIEPPFVLLGHSMGALLAFETARRLRDRGRSAPVLIVACACPAPHLPPSGVPAHTLSDVELVRQLKAKRTVAQQTLFDDPDLIGVVLPTIRADIELVETYSAAPGPPLSCPILAVGGNADTDGPRESLEAWRQHTIADFSTTVIPGDHFFITETTTVLPMLLERVRRLAARPVVARVQNPIAGAEGDLSWQLSKN